MFQTYRPSGRFGLSVFPWFVCGAVVTIALAYVYQLLIHWIPFIYINFLATLGFAVGLGMVACFVVNIAKVRSGAIAVLLAAALVVLGLGAKYWFQYRAMVNALVAGVLEDEEIPPAQKGGVAERVRAEFSFVDHLQVRAERGWRIGRGGGAPISGVFVYLVWLIEAGAVFFFAVSAAHSAGSEPFSEQLGKWADEVETIMLLPITSEKMVKQIQSAISVEQLLEIPIPETDASNQFAVYKVNSIEGEEMEDAYLTVDLMTISVNKKGEEEKSETNLVKHAILRASERQRLADNASLLNEAMADYRQALEAEHRSAAADADFDSPDDEDAAP